MSAKTLILILGFGVCIVNGRWPARSILPKRINTNSCPPTFKNQHPLILISMDGFRPDYLHRGLTPTLQTIADTGVTTPYMKSSYPSITFPNHYTIATGMYPPAHGIVANKFYDPVFKAEFRLGKPESFQRRFFGGEPIWKTAERQGKRAATFFWPGSEVEGLQPSYWFSYNESIPFSSRVDQVLAWLDLPQDRRPAFITLYMHEPDSAGHDFGPDSPQVNEKLQEVDLTVRRLLEGLKARRLLSCVNLLVLSDHGMAPSGQERAIILDQYIPNILNRTRFWEGNFGHFTPNDGSPQTKQAMMEALTCKKKEMRVFEKSTVPARWHVGKQRRIEEVVLDLDDGWTVGGNSAFKADIGEHGYDNYFATMNSLFMAHGPAFHRNLDVEIFQNIEVYNLMCVLLGVTPAPNNGTWGALHHLLLSPPHTLNHGALEYPPPVAGVPEEEVIEYYRPHSDCKGDVGEGEAVMSILEDTLENAHPLLSYHIPWGVPQMGHVKDYVLLMMQPDFVTGYSTLLKMPLWNSYTLRHNSGIKGHYTWTSDVRLKPQERLSCRAYDFLIYQKVFPHPLFPPHFTTREEFGQLAFLTSNAVPTSHSLKQRWGELEAMVALWRNRYGTINVISGPVFDYDKNSFADSLANIRHRGGVAMPSHMFMVVTRCLKWVGDLAHCPSNYLDTLAFIYPQHLYVHNCLSAERFAQLFSARVQDVEKITGLSLYPQLRHEDQLRLQIRIHSNIWGREIWANRLWSNALGLNK